MLSAILIFVAWTVAAFVGMELLSYGLHRWIFHGFLWKIHVTHHTKQHTLLEANDLFAIFFTGLAFVLMLVGFLRDPLHSIEFPIGLGMTIYGMLYFIIHDLMTHRRFFPLKPFSGWMDVVRRAHLRHHQSAEKDGLEPYGLFLFPYSKFRHPPERRSASRKQDIEQDASTNQ
ncbi:sterol desaturase family protein [bacterium]|nr:sterol desaturase family protein [bacterium]